MTVLTWHCCPHEPFDSGKAPLLYDVSRVWFQISGGNYRLLKNIGDFSWAVLDHCHLYRYSVGMVQQSILIIIWRSCQRMTGGTVEYCLNGLSVQRLHNHFRVNAFERETVRHRRFPMQLILRSRKKVILLAGSWQKLCRAGYTAWISSTVQNVSMKVEVYAIRTGWAVFNGKSKVKERKTLPFLPTLILVTIRMGDKVSRWNGTLSRSTVIHCYCYSPW